MNSLIDRRNQRAVDNSSLHSTRISRHNSVPDLIHVHVCVRCGHARRREEITGPEMASGIFQCPRCDSNGPLNVEIHCTYE